VTTIIRLSLIKDQDLEGEVGETREGKKQNLRKKDKDQHKKPYSERGGSAQGRVNCTGRTAMTSRRE